MIKISGVTDAMLEEAARIDDLDNAVKSIMDPVGITTGDVAGIHFSGYFGKEWPVALLQERVEMLKGWLQLESGYAALEDEHVAPDVVGSKDESGRSLRLPNGGITSDHEHFTLEWGKIRSPFEALGFRVTGFDPGVSLVDAQTGNGHFQLPIYAAERIIGRLSPAVPVDAKLGATA